MKKSYIPAFAFLSMITISILFSCKKDKPVQTIIPGDPVTDIMGNEYKTVKIGTQTWMVENLKTLKLNDGTSIQFINSNATWADPNQNASPMACAYENNVDNFNTYGALYNRAAVNTGKLAPEGWHVATAADWTTLKDYLIANGYNYDGTKVDNKIGKSLASTSGWTADPTLGNVGNDQTSNNKSGFNALPGGLDLLTVLLLEKGGITAFWFSDENGLDNKTHIESDIESLFFGGAGPAYGYSVRCVKN